MLMLSRLEARFKQLKQELQHVRGGARSLVFGIHCMASLKGSEGVRVPRTVLTDRRSIAVGLRLGMWLGILPGSEVRVMCRSNEIFEFVRGLEVEGGAGRFPVVLSRLLYVRHYTLFQPMRGTGRLIVM